MEEIDSFSKAFRDYMVLRGTPAAEAALRTALNVGESTFSELLVNTTGNEKQIVADSCLKVGNLVK